MSGGQGPDVRPAGAGPEARRRALGMVTLAAWASLAPALLGAAGLVAAIPLTLLAQATIRSAWAVVCYYAVGRSVWALLLEGRPEAALASAVLALAAWSLAREQVDDVWRALWGMPGRPPARGDPRPDGGRRLPP